MPGPKLLPNVRCSEEGETSSCPSEYKEFTYLASKLSSGTRIIEDLRYEQINRDNSGVVSKSLAIRKLLVSLRIRPRGHDNLWHKSQIRGPALEYFGDLREWKLWGMRS